jgi:hypothetical protein
MSCLEKRGSIFAIGQLAEIYRLLMLARQGCRVLAGVIRLFPRWEPSFMHLRPILHTDTSRSNLLLWKRVMVPEQTMEDSFPEYNPDALSVPLATMYPNMRCSSITA